MIREKLAHHTAYYSRHKIKRFIVLYFVFACVMSYSLDKLGLVNGGNLASVLGIFGFVPILFYWIYLKIRKQ